MAQSLTGTSLATTTAASVRRVAFRFIVDWAGVGFANVASWTDESAYVRTIRGDMQALGWMQSLGEVGHGVSDVCYITVANVEDTTTGRRFSPSNADGPLYDYIKDGAVCMTRAIVEMGFYSGSTAERLRQITGYIVDFSETNTQGTVMFEIRDRAAMYALCQASTTLQVDVSADDYITNIAQLADAADDVMSGVPSDTPVSVFDSLTGGGQVEYGMIPMDYAWMDDESVWREMADVAEAQLGRVYFDKAGNFRFEDGAHLVAPVNVLGKAHRGADLIDPATSQFTFDTSDFGACNPEYDYNSLFNHVIVEYFPRYVSVTQSVYEASETYVIPPEGSLTVKAEFRYPVSSVVTPVAETDYQANTSSGRDMNADLTLTLANYATFSQITMANANADYAMYMTVLQLRGTPVLPYPACKYEVEDTASIGIYGRRTKKINNPYIQSYRHAQMVGDYLLARFKSPVQQVSLTGCRGVPWLECGDRVTVESDNLDDTYNEYLIGRIAWSYGPNQPYRMDFDLLRASDLFSITDYFVVGVSVYGGGTGHGHLFW